MRLVIYGIPGDEYLGTFTCPIAAYNYAAAVDPGKALTIHGTIGSHYEGTREVSGECAARDLVELLEPYHHA